MRVVIVGEFELSPDEAMRKTAQKYYKYLQNSHNIKSYSPKEMLFPSNIKQIRDFKPHILHFVPGPSIFSLSLTKIISKILPETKIIHSCLHHGFHSSEYGIYYGISNKLKSILPLVEPDLLLTQSKESKKFFSQYGYNCEHVFGGVDTEKFTPVTQNKKLELRQKYNIPKNKFVCLHVGSIREWRNLIPLANIIDQNTELVIVGSSATPTENETEKHLRANGAIIIDDYIEMIEEMYQLSDCYVFPTTNPIGCCDIPLTILEAISCNLPVVTTPFVGVPDIPEIKNTNGVNIIEDVTQFRDEVHHIQNSDSTYDTREVAVNYDWEAVTKNVSREYEELVK